MNRDLIKSFIGCLLFLPLLITGTAAAQEKIKAGISSFSASYISMFIANKRGYYAEEGMSVDIILIAGLLGTRALIGGSVEFGSASNPTAAVQGRKIKDADGLQRETSLSAVRATGDQVGDRVARQENRRLNRGESGIWLDQRVAAEIWFAARSRRDFSTHRSHGDPLHGSEKPPQSTPRCWAPRSVSSPRMPAFRC